jgi:6-pyruvoyltetrahydropterin/6-carboxytetrahydropterin synthase
MYTATKEFAFEAAHMLNKHPGKCANLHGHNYKVFLTMASDNLDDMDMVKDFYDIKKFADPLFDKLDHSFMYNLETDDPFEIEIFNVVKKHKKKYFTFNHRATAENMSQFFYEYFNEKLADEESPVKIIKVTVYETPTSYATFE